MAASTTNSGRGYPARYNEADFSRDFQGSSLPLRSVNSGRGYPARYNELSFSRSPGSPGGDYQEGIISVDAGITANVLEIDTWEVQSTLYAPLGVVVTSAGLNSIARNVDRIRLEPRQKRIRLEPI